MILKFVLVFSLLASPALASAVKGYADSGIKGGPRATYEAKGAPTVQERHYETKGAALAQTSVAPERHYETKGAAPAREWEPAPITTKTIERHEQQQVQVVQAAAPAPTKTIERATEQRREEIQQLQQSPADEQQRELVQQREEQLPLAAPTKSIKSADDSRLEQQRLEQQRLEQERLEQQRLEQQRLDEQRLEQQRLEQQRLAEQRLEQQRLEQQRYEQLQQQREEQQSVELARESYEQRRYTEEQYQQQQIVQHREEAIKGAAPIKGQAPIAQQALVAEPEPYAFDYSVEGSSRRESGDTKGVVRGQYTLQGADGSSRIVDYVADHNGFRATVNTNEFGTESRSSAGVDVRSSQPAAEDISLRLEGKTREYLEAPPAIKSAPLEPPKRPDNWSVKQGPINVAAPQTPIQLQQTPIPQVLVAAPLADEAPRAIKGKTIEEIRAPIKGRELAQPAPLLSQQKLEAEKDFGQQAESLPVQEPLKEQAPIAQAPAKGELRAPKALGELKRAAEEIGQLRSPGFESATAHRPSNVHHSVVVPSYSSVGAPSSPIRSVGSSSHQYQPVVSSGVRSIVRPVVSHSPSSVLPVAPVHHRQQPPVRSQFVYDRHPVIAPVAVRRGHYEPSPRLSFYNNAVASGVESVDDSSSFEHPVGE